MSDRPARIGRDVFISYTPADEPWATWIAWELEAAGYHTLIQAWDFVAGTQFVDIMDWAVQESRVVLAVLSPRYMESRGGRMEWQATMRSDPDKLVTVLIEPCRIDGLLGNITYIDLAGAAHAAEARQRLLTRLEQALAGRAKPSHAPGFPPDGPAAAVSMPERAGTAAPRRQPAVAPAYPRDRPQVALARSAISILHVSGPRFGRGLDALTAADLQARVWANVTRLTDSGVAGPDLIVVSGDLTESARPQQVADALSFLTALRVALGLEPHRLVIVPGAHDVSRPACLSYFARCEDMEVQPRQPFYPKLEHFAKLFAELYQGLTGPVFDVTQPWTLFEFPDLRVVVAGLNSTVAINHRPEEDYGWIGEAQAAWFAARLRRHEEAGWLRIGVMRHDPVPGGEPAGADPELLRDAGTFDQLLGRRLNVLLHGPGPGGVHVDSLASGLPVLPAAGPATDEIVEVTPAGLRRWSSRNERPEEIARRWHACAATFAQPVEAAGAGSRPGEPDRTPDPVGRLLERIAEVCRVRHERMTIRRIESSPGQVMLTRDDDGIITQWRICAHVGTPSRADLEEFLASDPEPRSELVYHGSSPGPALREEALRRGVRLRSFTEFQGLLDLSGYVAEQTLRLTTDRVYPPALYVPQRYRELDRDDQHVKDDLVAALLRLMADDDGRFVLVLGDFGRGKTYALREVARRIAEQYPHLVPILIELRELDKAHNVDGLVAAHLANRGEELGLRAFQYMLRQGRIVLLFDGFDELVTRVTYERAAEHLETLLRAAQDDAKIIVASRTQHFKSHTQVLTAMGQQVGRVPSHRILSVEAFTPTQVRDYLVNRYGGSTTDADRRVRLINGIQDLRALAQNPRMLSFIADLDDDLLRGVAQAGGTTSAAGLYRKILEEWVLFESRRALGPRGAPAGMGRDELWHAVTTLALRIWDSGEPFLRLDELTEVADSLTRLAQGHLTTEQTAYAIGSGSLLVRNSDDMFGFIHGSVAEWLVANFIAGLLPGDPPQLRRRTLSQLTVDFLCDLADTRACQEWAARALGSQPADEIAQANAWRIVTRLRTPPATALRGASLRDQDLSYRELAGVDLTGADLTGALLMGANLTGAVLRNASLIGARLDGAQLGRADLSGADLRLARLTGADLTGATLAGSHWNRAALINVTGLPDAGELRGAAVHPGQPVETEFAPAEIGVRHGFHPELGRLPEVLAYSPDGSTLAIGSDDGGVLVCDTATGQPVRTLQGHRGRVFAVSYGPDGRVLATAASDGHVDLWDPATGQRVHRLSTHQGWAWPMVVSPSGDLLVTADEDGVAYLWSTTTGDLVRTMSGALGLMYTAAFQPGGDLLAAGYRVGSVHLWDMGTGRLRLSVASDRGPIYRVVFDPSGSVLAAGGDGASLRLIDPRDGSVRHDLVGHSGRVYTLAFHPTGALLASGDTNGDVRLWDTATGICRAALHGHQAGIYWVAFSPSGDLLATGDSAGGLRLWDMPGGQLRHALSGHTGSVWPFAFRPDGHQLAVSDDQFTVRLWNPQTGVCQHVLTGHGRRVTSVSFSDDGGTLATSGNDGMVRLWSAATGEMRQLLVGTDDRLVTLETAQFSPLGSLLATVGNDGRINLLNLGTGRYERHLSVQTPAVWALTFNPSAELIATANDDDTVRIWWRGTGRMLHNLAEHRGRVRSIAFHPGGALLATGCDDRRVRLWSVETGELLATLDGHEDRVYAVSFSADGALLASASWDGTARVWSVAERRQAHVLRRHLGRLWTAAFSPSGTILATAGDDLVVRLWDADGGVHLDTLVGHTRGIWSVSFSPDGSMLASGSDDGTTRLWSLGTSPTPRLTLLGLPGGWAALAPGGRYKTSGDVKGQFWHVIGMCRFDCGELDDHLTSVGPVALDSPL